MPKSRAEVPYGMTHARRQSHPWQHYVTLAFVLGAVAIVAWFLYHRMRTDRPRADHGAIYAASLEAMIRRADRILITEHSWPGDYDHRGRPDEWTPPEVEYDRAELDASQRTRFADRVASMDKTTQYSVAGCLMAPHHTMTFYRDGKLLSTIAICFECGMFEWDASPRQDPPQAIFDVLAPTVADAGLQPERDWHELAAATLAAQLNEPSTR